MTDIEFGFTRAQEDATALMPYLNPLPRSVTGSKVFILLDGGWRFALDVEDRGLQERWYLGHSYSATTEWPGSIEAQMATGHDTLAGAEALWPDQVVAWYERDFEVPADWAAEAEAVQVTFGACGYETRVWLNGKLLSTIEGEELHLGEWTSFSYELSREYLAPLNRLTVRVADSLNPDQPRGKQASHVYKRGGIWYQTISGPVRSVWLEPIERNRLRSRLGVLSNVEDQLVEFRLTTRVRDPGLYRLRVVVSSRGGDKPLAMKDVELPLEPGERRQHLTLALPDAELWSPAHPVLYAFVAQLTDPAGQVSQIAAHFGLRQIEARGGWVYLNGERLYLDGILYQPATSTYEEMRRHLSAIKELGCNLVRVHIAGIDPRIYQLADELGLLVWVEVPSPHRPGRKSRAAHRAELQRLLVQIGVHPSVVILSLYNEGWGAQDVAANPETRAYIAQTYAELRRHEPQLLVVGNDGWQNVSTEGRLESDLLTAHIYRTEPEDWRQSLDRLVAGDTTGVAALPLVVGDPFFSGGQVPLLVSESGGFGFQPYGGPEDLSDRAERIRAFKRELTQRPLAGDVYTQATSVEDEDNGLIEPQTGALLVTVGLLASGAMERVRVPTPKP
jgi:beta-galactosidase/beta-glucuronidase